MNRFLIMFLCGIVISTVIGYGQELPLVVEDVPNDDGSAVSISWQVPEGAKELSGIKLFKKKQDAAEFKEIMLPGIVPMPYTLSELTPKEINVYKLTATDSNGNQLVFMSQPVQSTAQWFNTSKVNVLIALIIFTACVIVFINRAKRGESLYIRKIAGLEALDDAVGRATEMGRPVFHVPGIGTISDVATLASLSIMRRVARRVAEYNVPFIVPCTEPMVMTTAQEVVKTAYAEAGRPDQFNPDHVSYLTYDQFGYAAGVDGMLMRDKPGAVLLLGYFMAESLILAETGNAIGAIQIAGTDQTSQLPFFVAACDYTLIGEELYAASSYLSREPIFLGSLKGQDLVKVIILVLICCGVVLSTLGWIAGEGSGLARVAGFYENLFASIGAGE